MAKYRVLAIVCYLLISVIYASDNLSNNKLPTFTGTAEETRQADEEEGLQQSELKAMSPTDQPKRDNLSIRKMHDRQNRSPDLLVDMGEPKMLKDDFADIFEKEPEREAVSTMNTKLVYANELKDRKKSKIEDFVITPLKYKSHTFHLKKGKAACSLDKFTGPCRSRKTRYFYNIRTEECEEFIYGGCRGNGNNFLSKADCEDACAK
ncbi:amyloid-beta A4 protein-like isoform X3 [Pecten maximus]|uniref:amyloid-beta A4 protein-like isoform X3 n=1 Tax=Pecten maximus TaxID=6579 RepID=UPI001458C6F2|nr:amyloid-beta A4 protein-like isoform X3 [Pecten maximus]